MIDIKGDVHHIFPREYLGLRVASPLPNIRLSYGNREPIGVIE